MIAATRTGLHSQQGLVLNLFRSGTLYLLRPVALSRRRISHPRSCPLALAWCTWARRGSSSSMQRLPDLIPRAVCLFWKEEGKHSQLLGLGQAGDESDHPQRRLESRVLRVRDSPIAAARTFSCGVYRFRAGVRETPSRCAKGSVISSWEKSRGVARTDHWRR